MLYTVVRKNTLDNKKLIVCHYEVDSIDDIYAILINAGHKIDEVIVLEGKHFPIYR